ncbi:hypothetical protein BDR26DRAFT_862820 [Obelidium mucronatum]|nr:hypothetical protein BDR26DRAFT_862820 [Obelidium mucronatum]
MANSASAAAHPSIYSETSSAIAALPSTVSVVTGPAIIHQQQSGISPHHSQLYTYSNISSSGQQETVSASLERNSLESSDGKGSRIIVVKHVERKRRTEKILHGSPSMEELRKKKNHLNQLTSHLTQLTTNLLQKPLSEISQTQTNIPRLPPSVPSSPTKISPPHSPLHSAISSPDHALVNYTNQRMDQELRIQPIPDPSVTISSLQSTISSKNSELEILRNVIKGASKQFDLSLAPSTGAGQDIDALKAWIVALCRRIKEFESIPYSENMPPRTGSQSPDRGRKRIADNRTIETQTWDSQPPGSKPIDDNEQQLQLKHLQETIKSLSTQNASLLLQAETSKSLEPSVSATTVTKLQQQVVDLKLSIRDTETKLRDIEAENHELKAQATLHRERSRSPSATDTDVFYLGVKGPSSPLLRPSTPTDISRKLAEAAHRCSALESTNARLLKDNNHLREDMESLAHQLDQNTHIRHENKEAIHEASMVIKTLKADLNKKNEEMMALKNQWDKERIRWIEERKKSVDNLNLEVAASGFREDGNLEILGQLQAELNRYKRESEQRTIELTERCQKSEEKALALEQYVKTLEKERSEAQILASAAQAKEDEAQTIIMELENSIQLIETDHAAVASDYRIRVAELENIVGSLQTQIETQQDLDAGRDLEYKSQIVKLEAANTQLEAEFLAKSIQFQAQLTQSMEERNELAAKLAAFRDEDAKSVSTPAKSAATPLQDSPLLLSLQSENLQLKDALTSLNQDLESSNQRYFQLSQTLKQQTLQHKLELESSSLVPESQYKEALENHAYEVASLQHQLEITKDRYHASQAKSQSLLDALNRTEAELARLRLSQADIGTALLKKGNEASAHDVITSLHEKNGELAAQVMGYREEMDELRETIELQRMRAYEREALVVQAGELKREVEDLTAKIQREKETWGFKERALYSATEKLQSDYQELVKTMTSVQKVIWESAESRVGWNRGIGHAGGERVEDVDVIAWVKWMADVNSRLEKGLTESHEIMDMQQEKLESVIAMSSAAISRRSHSPPPDESGRRSSRGIASDAGALLESGYSLSSSSSSVNALVNWSNAVAETNSAGYHSHNQPLQQSAESSDENQDIVLPLPFVFDKKLSTEKMAATMKKLMTKNVSLQQKLSSIEAQLDHQIKSNVEIKKMFVDSALGRSSDTSPLLEQYNDALVEIGALRTEVEHWRARYDEMEAVVEGVVIERISSKDELSKRSSGVVTPSDES